jgi:hypothetical protein
MEKRFAAALTVTIPQFDMSKMWKSIPAICNENPVKNFIQKDKDID